MLEAPKEEITRGIKISGDRISTIRFENVEFKYPGNENFTFKINREFKTKKVYGIVGRTGSGKTTFVKLLMGLYFPQKGRILVDGVDLKDISLLEWRKNIGFLPQDPFIIRSTIEENIKLHMANIPHHKLIEAIKKSSLEEFINRMPNGISTIIGERGITISSGERERIALARIFLKDPPIIFLDEPTAQLDMITQKSIKDAILEWKGNKTIFIITHNFFFIDFTDEIILIENGEITHTGSHDFLMENSLIYKEMYELHKMDSFKTHEI